MNSADLVLSQLSFDTTTFSTHQASRPLRIEIEARNSSALDSTVWGLTHSSRHNHQTAQDCTLHNTPHSALLVKVDSIGSSGSSKVNTTIKIIINS